MNESIRVAIADADERSRMAEARLIALAEGTDLACEAADSDTLLQQVEDKRPHVVLLDSRLPGIGAAECARMIHDIDPSVIVIFTVSEGDSLDAVELDGFDCLAKPIATERALDTIRRVREGIQTVREGPGDAQPPIHIRPNGQRLMLRHRDGVAFVDQNDILLVQREDLATVIYAEGGARYVVQETLSEMDERLSDAIFFRCHKGYIVNLNKISAVEPYGRWTYVIKLVGTRQTALITHEKFEELARMFG